MSASTPADHHRPPPTPAPEPTRPSARRFCVAPMIDRTDRYARYFYRLLSQRCTLYTEMITTSAIIHGDKSYHLAFDGSEHPLALQLGGSDPGELATCARIAADYGYDELNLNCGCPSDRVLNGRFGACLMREPRRVAECIKAMKDATALPITVKHRIGVDNETSYSELLDFVGIIAEQGCSTFIVHARHALLQGLSPKQNREIPPLDYGAVYRLKRDLPQLEIVINGGIDTLPACQQHLDHVDGVMLGREVYQNPYLLTEVDSALYADHSKPPPPRDSVLNALLPFIEQALADGARLHHITRHVLGLYHGQRGARQFRRLLTTGAQRADAGIDVVLEAMEMMADHEPNPKGAAIQSRL